MMIELGRRIQGSAMDAKEGGGLAAIYGPDGRDLVQTLSPMEEGILYADINLDDLLMAKLVVDSVGHYSRPDLLSLHVNSPINPLVRQQCKKEEEYNGLLFKIPQLVDD
ncbi:hypothetical protein PM082_017989 [Marasmius tenuissimus]|nr:hypothetical protein PM082_017989 [Marasmius tenuissimus]